MRIGIPVAQFHPGNTAEYVQRAFRALGHEAQLLDALSFASAFAAKHFDLYFCVDSGEALSLRTGDLSGAPLKNVAFWMIDFRHNKERPERSPTDLENARELDARGGWIFQAQQEDVDFCVEKGLQRVSFLPVAADSEIWASEPAELKQFDVAFIGSVWDQARVNALQQIANSGLQFGFFGHRKVWGKQAARALRLSRCGFNITSFFGESWSYDLNMRFFETLSCGVPIVTNKIPALGRLFGETLPPFVCCYEELEQIVPTIRAALGDSKFTSSGVAARNWIIDGHTYVDRMRLALSILESKGAI